MRLVLLFFLILSMVAPSCKKKYESATPAFFIKPSSVIVDTSAGQGSDSHNISDLWLYVNGQFQGAYPMDATLPILSDNKIASISLFAGIRNNGISTTRIPWQFYEVLEL